MPPARPSGFAAPRRLYRLDLLPVNGLPDPAPPAEDYDANGVDRTLIRACLRESPLECLQMLEEMHQLAESVRGAWKTDSFD
jgi:hypothetical protein